MLLRDLHYFYKILSTPYDKFNLFLKGKHNLNENILEDLYLKKCFNSLWIKKLNINPSNIKTKYKYKILEKNCNLIKIKFKYLKSFSLSNSPKGIISYSLDEYLLILTKTHHRFKIIFLVNKEENPNLYEEILKKDILQITNIISSNKISVWSSKIKVLDRLYDKYLKINNCYRTPYSIPTSSSYNPLKACEYAEKFALKANPEYKSFEGIGGDCTNFVSQALYSGGLKNSNTWKPYSNAWVRVEELYLYIIKNELGMELKENIPLKKGDIIQFYTPKLGRFFHSGIITHILPDGDYLYCCHSYNKLNYPLSLTYPILYPKIRSIEIY
ncbi:amidase domain-containing protein [Clostridium taeniosporum]|uniref:Putative amidase domain-containing protein n=1 Tax=Clostridium taeniosporum TaxID=394958 RepID=A0A1D7XIY9_9CLOT|nr:amidase domain-containing protein [Clostridium taeniosporum]AOR23301.1 hypothetical protein BGI42_05945 [Clostridium taeniosporum]